MGRDIVKSYEVLDIANYIVYKMSKKEDYITHLQLQKTLYFLEVHNLHYNGTPLYKEEIEAWKLGPVYPKVYHVYKSFGANEITSVPKVININEDTDTEGYLVKWDEFDPQKIEDELKVQLDPLIDKILELDGFKLVKLTHKHEPWREFIPALGRGERKLTYDKIKLKYFFSDNPNYLKEVIDG